MHRKLSSLLLAAVLVAGVFVLAPARAGTPRAERSSPTASSAEAQESPTRCRRCKRIIRKARRCKREGNTSPRCKRLQRKARRCRRYLRTGACRTGGTPTTPACDPYIPGEQGSSERAVEGLQVVTDAATEEKPIEVVVPTDPAADGEPADTAHRYVNIQVDTAAAESGLYARFEFLEPEDYDIYLNNAAGEYQAQAAGYNPAPVGPLDGTGHGGHSEVGAEQLDGIKTPDCGGYTLDLKSYATPGGDKTLKLWLGEATFEPGSNPP